MSQNSNYKVKLQNAYSKSLKIPYEPGIGGAEQTHEKSCNINNIVNKFQRTGTIEHQNKHEARYDDITGQDFETMMNIVANAQSMFEDLPSGIRAKFDNSPSQFLDYVQNPANKAEAVELGIMSEDDNWTAPPSRIDTTGMEPESTADRNDGTIQQTETTPSE